MLCASLAIEPHFLLLAAFSRPKLDIEKEVIEFNYMEYLGKKITYNHILLMTFYICLFLEGPFYLLKNKNNKTIGFIFHKTIY